MVLLTVSNFLVGNYFVAFTQKWFGMGMDSNPMVAIFANISRSWFKLRTFRLLFTQKLNF